jgi:hypothetical protein
MNLRKVICWFKGHNWKVFEEKRHCVACGYKPKDDVRFCPKCGSERIRGCIMVSWGYQYCMCMKCNHKFQDTSDSEVTVTHGQGCYTLEKPMVDQDGEPITPEEI